MKITLKVVIEAEPNYAYLSLNKSSLSEILSSEIQNKLGAVNLTGVTIKYVKTIHETEPTFSTRTAFQDNRPAPSERSFL